MGRGHGVRRANPKWPTDEVVALKRIARKRNPYRTAADVRREPLRLGKYLYLAVISTILLTLFHVFFGHLYQATGEGFVYADNREVGMSFPATVTEMPVESGQRVRAGDILFRVDSYEIESRLRDLEDSYIERLGLLNERLVKRREYALEIEQLGSYLQATADLETRYREAREKGLVTEQRYFDTLKQRFEAERDLETARAELSLLQTEIENLRLSVERRKEGLEQLRQTFADGIRRAPIEGVVANVKVARGSVVRQSQSVLRVFSDARYLLTFMDTSSFVSVAPGDRVLVYIPGRGYEVGLISRLTEVSEDLPSEFQPKFKPTQRQRLARVVLPGFDLGRLPILSTVQVSKPLGLGWALDAAALWEDRGADRLRELRDLILSAVPEADGGYQVPSTTVPIDMPSDIRPPPDAPPVPTGV